MGAARKSALPLLCVIIHDVRRIQVVLMDAIEHSLTRRRKEHDENNPADQA